MPRIRTTHPEILCSESMSRVSLEAELVFPRLWLIVDDAGRARSDGTLLAAQLFPRRKGMEMMLTIWLDELEREGCIGRFRVGEVDYLHIVNWRKWQQIDRPTPSRLPAPPRLARGSRGDSASPDKPLEEPEDEASSRVAREETGIPRGADGKVAVTDDWLREKMSGALVRAEFRGRDETVLRAAIALGRASGLWRDRRRCGGQAPVSGDSAGRISISAGFTENEQGGSS